MVEIILARKEHVKQIEAVWKEYLRVNSDAEPLWNPGQNAATDFMNELKKHLGSNDALVLVAVEQEQVVGFSIAEIDSEPPVFKLEKWGTITDIGIKKEYRRGSIGKKLVDETMKWFREKGITLVQIYALTNNSLAMSFWPKQGFRLFSQRMYRLTGAPEE